MMLDMLATKPLGAGVLCFKGATAAAAAGSVSLTRGLSRLSSWPSLDSQPQFKGSTSLPSLESETQLRRNHSMVFTRGLKIIAKHGHQASEMKKIKGIDVFVDETTDTIYTKNTFPHEELTMQEMGSITVTHRVPRTLRDRYALWLVRMLRFGFDICTGYRHPKPKHAGAESSVIKQEDYKMTPEKWISRFIFLESIAGVPGMVGAFIRHLHSLRLLRRDKAWIETLCDEAYNERMHLLTFIEIGKPSFITRAFLYAAQ
mgnify:CR=1 FL=1